MKRIILLTVIFLSGFFSTAQESNFSLDLSYPITLDNNFIGSNYNGIIDVGATYIFSNSNQINFGVSFNGSILQNNANKNVGQPFKITCFALKPRLMVELNPAYFAGFNPFIGMGYSFLVFDVSNSENEFSDATGDTQSGFNFNLGMGYALSERFYGKVQYDFVKASVPDGVSNVKFNSHVSLLKIGVGYRF